MLGLIELNFSLFHLNFISKRNRLGQIFTNLSISIISIFIEIYRLEVRLSELKVYISLYFAREILDYKIELPRKVRFIKDEVKSEYK